MSFDNRRASAMDGASSSGNPDTASPAAASVPLMCRAGCGFYANSAFDGMCSKCYKEKMQQTVSSATTSPTSTVSTCSQSSSPSAGSARQSDATTDADSVDAEAVTETVDTLALPDVTTGLPTVCSAASIASIESTNSESDAGDGSSDSGKEKSKKKRCAVCKKRVGLTGFDCRCGGHFCSTHRYSDTHQCAFNYHALAQSEIRKHNPVVAAEKVKKI